MTGIAICAIVKNEGLYIEEWINYHIYIGVNHFFICDNGSTDGTVERLSQFGDKVTLNVFPGHAMQIRAYQHVIANHRYDWDWLAFIDVDEFITMRKDIALRDYLDSLPPETTGLFVHWLFFGSNGHEIYESKPVVSRFTKRAQDEFYVHQCGKTIVRGRHALPSAGIHIVPSDGLLKNDAGDVIDQNGNGHTDYRSHDFIALNHYFTKTFEEWRLRRSIGQAPKAPDDPHFRRSDKEFYDHDINVIDDTVARDFYMLHASPK